jgi:hypothetical protein
VSKEGKRALERIDQAINSETRSLPHAAYRDFLEELHGSIEARLEAHRGEHPELYA